MKVALTDQDQGFVPSHDYLLSKTLAWRALGRAMGVAVEDPRHVIDGGGVLTEYATGMHFDLTEAQGDRCIRIEETDLWDGSRWSLSPRVTYVSYSVAPNRSFVEFHGWYRPKQRSRPLGKNADDPCSYLCKTVNRHAKLTHLGGL